MANYLITGYHGEPHVTAENDRGINAGIAGTGRYVLPVGEQFKAEYIGNNTVRLYDGKLIDNGAAAGIPAGEYIDLQISNASQGYYRNDLIVFQYKVDTSTLIENGTFLVVQGTETTGTPSDPTLTQQNLLSGSATMDQMALWRVKVEGTTINDPVKRFTLAETLKEHGHTVSDISGILPMANGGTSSTKLADAPNGAVVYKLEDGTNSHLWYKASSNGAFYATGDNVIPKFGTLPVAQGGTGSTTASGARTNLGITPANIGAATSGHTHTAADVGALPSTGGTLAGNVTNTTGGYFAQKTVGSAVHKSGIGVNPNTGDTYVSHSVDGAEDNYMLLSSDYTSFKVPVSVAGGGTGATTAAAARANLGAASSSHTHTVANITDLTATATELNYMDGVTSNVQTQLNGKSSTSHTHTLSGDTITGFLPVSKGGTNSDLSSVRDGNIIVKQSNAETGNAYYSSIITVPVANGGTGAATAADARTNLGITPANIGAATSGHTHSLSGDAFTSYLPMSKGGTGSAILGNTTDGYIIRKWSSDDGTPYLYGAEKLGIANGGTGATTASAARTNLGMGCTTLWSGSLASSDATATITDGFGDYSAYVVLVRPNGSDTYYVPATIPLNIIGTSEATFIAASSDYYVTFTVYRSGTTLYVKWKGQNNSGTITRVYGLI